MVEGKSGEVTKPTPRQGGASTQGGGGMVNTREEEEKPTPKKGGAATKEDTELSTN